MRVSLPIVGDIEISRHRKRPRKDVEVTAELGQLVSDAQTALAKRHTSWKTFDEYYFGEQKINKDVNYDVVENRDMYPLNYCMSTVETMIPILLDAAPMWYVLQEGVGQGSPLVEDATMFLQAFWHYAKIDHTLEEVCRDMIVYGTGVGKVYWDSEKMPVERMAERVEIVTDEETGEANFQTITETEEERLGDVAIEWCDPFSIFPDPNARRLDECRYVALKTELSKEDLQRQFEWLDEDDIATVSGSDRQRLRPREQEEKRTDLAEVWEVYHEFGQKLTIYTGSTILYEGDNPMPGKRFPVVFFTNRRRGGWMFGQSCINDIMATQDFLNLANVHVATNMRYAMNPQLLTNDPKLKEYTNKPGGVVYVESKIRGEKGFAEWQEIPELPSSLFIYMDRLQRTLDVQSGVHDVMEGVKPKGITSGIALAQLNEGAQGRLRLLIRSMAKSIEDMGQLVLDMMVANYAEDRSIAQYEGESPEVVSLGVTSLPKLGGSQYRVIVQGRGELPLNPAAQLDIAMQLYGAGVIDQVELLKVAKWPNPNEVVSRMQQAQMEQMAGAAQAQGLQMMPSQEAM